MSHHNVLFFTIAASILLTGCGPTYRETLEQKLAGKAPDEKRAILAEECGNEIQNGLKPDDEANVRHFQNMKRICEEMTGERLEVAFPVVSKRFKQ